MRRSAKNLTVHGKEQKTGLVDAAYGIIAEKGFEGLRTRAVAGRAGVNIATLHYYFPTKEDLIKGVTEQLTREFQTIVDPALQSVDLSNPIETLRKEFADQAYAVRVHPQTYIVLMELYTRSLRDPKMRKLMRDLLLNWEAHLSSYLAAGVKNGDFPAVSNVEIATKLLQCLLMGTVTNLLIVDSHYPVTAIHEEFAAQLGAGRTKKPIGRR